MKKRRREGTRRHLSEHRRKRQEMRKGKSPISVAPEKKQVPRTLDSTRELDETTVTVDDAETIADIAQDDFASYFTGNEVPNVMITTARHPGTLTFSFIRDLLTVFPNCKYIDRQKVLLSRIAPLAAQKGFSDIIVISESRKELHGLTLIHLPNGPTAHFRLSGVVLRKMIKGHGNPTSHIPEVILNNFTTRLGHAVGRMLAALFDPRPEFVGRRVCTFHNQRDFIFFRHHRYVFQEKEGETRVSARVQELGPRFSLKLRWLQNGMFETRHGEYIWKHKRELDTSRRRFFL